MKYFYTLCVLLVSYLSIGQATTYMSDNFDYPAGAQLTDHGWYAHSQAGNDPILVSSEGLSWVNYIGSGIGNAALVVNDNEDVNKPFSVDADSGSVYSSFLMKVNNSFSVDGEGVFYHFGRYASYSPNADFSNLSNARRGRTHVLQGDDVNTQFKLGLSFNSSSPDEETGNLNIGETYLVVLKYTFVDGPDNDEVSLFVFSAGADISSEPATADIGPLTGTASDANSLQAIGLRQYDANQDVTVDGIYTKNVWDIDNSPKLFAIPNELNDLNYIEGDGPSAVQSFTLSGTDLDNSDLVLNLPADSNFEMASDVSGPYDETLTLTAFDGTETDIYVRLKDGLQVNMYSDDITLSGGGADPVIVNLSGQVGEEIFLIYEFTGDDASPTQSPLGATTTDFQVSMDGLGFGNAQASTWSAGSGVPYANSQTNWAETDVANAKYFHFTATADTGFEMDATHVSFEWRATGNGPSAITVEINGTEVETFDAVENTTSVFSAPIPSATNLNEIEVKIKGWDNGSRSTSGGGFFRINDVRIDGDIFSTTSVLVSDPNQLNDLNYIEENGPSMTQSFTLSGIDLNGMDVSANLPAGSNFEIADDVSGPFGEALTFTAFDGTETEVYVRLKGGLQVDMYNDDITLSGGGADPTTVSLSGQVGEEIFLIYEFTDEVATPTQSPSNATTSDFQVSQGNLGFGNSQSSTWSAGSGVPYGSSQTDWAETDVENAKYFSFTITADDGYNMEANNISFEWRATGNGPSAITIEINGTEVETFDAVENTTSVFSAPITNAEDLTDIEIRIKGWDNGSRNTSGGGFFRINDVRLDGSIEESLSTDEFNSAGSIKVFPNPCTDGQFIITTEDFDAGDMKLNIYNLVGQQVYSKTYQASNEINVYANDLNTGVYIIELLQSDKRFTKRLIIK